MADTFVYRIDHHGSLVRPPELVSARRQHAAGERSSVSLRELEDEHIAEAVRAQRKRNMTVVTDGHFRRGDPFSVFSDAIKGLGDGQAEPSDELERQRSLLVEDTEYVSSLTTMLPAKATLPSPAAAAEEFAHQAGPSAPWQSARELGEAIARIVREEIEHLFASGVRYIQLDHHGYGSYLDGASTRSDRQLSLADAAAIDAMAVEAIEQRPEGAAIGICPMTQIGPSLDQQAAETLFSSIPVDRWILPYHTGAPQELELVRLAPADSDICLGVVDASTPELEDVETVMRRLDAVDGVRDFERVALSPNQGFADTAARPLLGSDEQWDKLVHVETLARMAWGNEL